MIGFLAALMLLCLLTGFWSQKQEVTVKFRQFMFGNPTDQAFEMGARWFATIFPFAPTRSWLWTIVLFGLPFLCGSVVGWMEQSWLLFLIGVGSACFAPWIGYQCRCYFWRRRCRFQMREALHLTSTALRSGTIFVEAMARAAQEVSQPMRGLLLQAVREIRLGKPEGEAFHKLVEMTGERTFSPLAALISLTLIKGGKLANILDDALQYMEEDEELLADLRGETSSYRMSAYLLPFILLGVIVGFRSAMAPILAHTWFLVLFFAALGSMIVGILLTFRLIRKLDI